MSFDIRISKPSFRDAHATANAESIFTNGGYGFPPTPPRRFGRNDSGIYTQPPVAATGPG
jgi:hypothetical protein